MSTPRNKAKTWMTVRLVLTVIMLAILVPRLKPSTLFPDHHLQAVLDEQVERGCVQPLQIVEEEGERMFRPREYADKSTEHQLEAALRVLWGKFRDRRLFSYNQLQFGDQVHNELSVRTYRLTKGITATGSPGSP